MTERGGRDQSEQFLGALPIVDVAVNAYLSTIINLKEYINKNKFQSHYIKVNINNEHASRKRRKFSGTQLSTSLLSKLEISLIIVTFFYRFFSSG